MSRSILVILVIVIVGLGLNFLVSLTRKKPLSLEEFAEKAKMAGCDVHPITDVEDGGIGCVAVRNKCRFAFYCMNSRTAAIWYYENVKSKRKRAMPDEYNWSSGKKTRHFDYCKMWGKTKFLSISRVEKTVLLCEGAISNKKEIVEFCKEMGY